MLKKPVNLKDPNFPIMYSNWTGINEDDEVLTTPLTCMATNAAIVNAGLKLRWVDIDPNTCNMDLDDLARKITSKTKAIMIVHWGGYPVDLDKLKEIQNKAKEKFGFKPAIVEDCAHALGSTFNGKKIGTHGNIAVFSLQAIKHVTSVDGGIVSYPHSELYKRGNLLRWYGIDREDKNRPDFRCETDVSEIGFKYHMNDVSAIIGMENFKRLDNIIKLHRDNARFYNEELSKIDGIKLMENSPKANSANWLYTIKVRDRDNFMKAMKDRGVITSRVHERNDKHSCFMGNQAILPNLDKLVNEMICIPVGWWVTDEDREYILEQIKRGW
jgi:dTDP-4-amino-4,6-dideoxygalactose transaminase